MKHSVKWYIFTSIYLILVSPLSLAESTGISADLPNKNNGDIKQTVSKMSNQRLDVLIKRLDKNAEGKPGYWSFMVNDQKISVITDERADRMRILVPIIKSEELKPQQLTRLMQANFDSTLDARYAIAKGILWSAFIHPLSSLTDEEFLVGLGQVINLTVSYGGSYSSGLLIFRGGDSKDLRNRELIDELLNKGLTV